LLLIAIIASWFICVQVMGEPGLSSVPKGESQVFTGYEGNLTYYVKAGQKVRKGAPLFFVQRNDIPSQASHIMKLKADAKYWETTYERNKTLVKTHSVSQQAFDDSSIQYADAKNNLNDYITQMYEGLYYAPFDCEVTKLLYVQHGGVGDGNPVINIKEIPASEIKGAGDSDTAAILKKKSAAELKKAGEGDPAM
jgi:hypothetical protein